MISWMQKHNKYLIVTIWVATIAFIGAGFVGWGSYQYGSKASAIGKVGEVEITQEKFDMSYQNLYSQYNEAFKGKFDAAKAKEMGLPQQVFNSLVSQAKLLNLAKQYGIVVSEEELQQYIFSIQAFQKEGQFNKVIYDTYLKSRGLRPKIFEGVLRDELVTKKLTDFFPNKALPYEEHILASALGIADKISYKVLSLSDMHVQPTEKELEAYWEQFKENYMTPRAYELALLWTGSSDIPTDEKVLQAFYEKNSYNYVGADGKQFSFEKAKALVAQDFRLKKAKKKALKAYVSFKKGALPASETKELQEGDSLLSAEAWKKIAETKVGSIVKPKVVGDKYATIKILKRIEPRVMTFKEARESVAKALTAQKREALLDTKAKEALVNIDNETLSTTEWLTMSKFDNVSPLNQQETLQFLQKLFTSSEKKGMIAVSDNVVIYKVDAQKMDLVDSNLSEIVAKNVSQIKKSIFEKNLFEALGKKYPTQKFVKGI